MSRPASAHMRMSDSLHCRQGDTATVISLHSSSASLHHTRCRTPTSAGSPALNLCKTRGAFLLEITSRCLLSALRDTQAVGDARSLTERRWTFKTWSRASRSPALFKASSPATLSSGPQEPDELLQRVVDVVSVSDKFGPLHRPITGSGRRQEADSCEEGPVVLTSPG